MQAPLRISTLLVRGMLVGFIAAGLAFGFQSVFGEPRINQAIALEEHAAMAAGEAAEPEVVSREIQSTVGLASALVVYGGALGGIFALVFATAFGRLGLGARGTSLVVGLAGFVVVVLMPFLKYPANPPAVGDPETIGSRTVLYLAMLLGSVAAAIIAVQLRQSWVARMGSWNASLLAIGTYIVIVAIVQAVLPAVNEIQDGFPADGLWGFRVASLGGQLVLWTSIGLLFGDLTERSLRVATPERGQRTAARAV